jgi:outer membrane protein assembly factor BamB
MRTIGALVTSSPALGADGTIYLGGQDSVRYALDIDGALKWKHVLHNRVYTPAAGPGGTVCAGEAKGSEQDAKTRSDFF